MAENSSTSAKANNDNYIIVIGASAGGLNAIEQICAGLQVDFPLPVFIVWHLSEGSTGILPEMLKKKTALPIANAKNGEIFQGGHIYIAPPNRHLLIEDSKIRTVFGPKENRFRPAIDPLFRSAAYSYDSRVIGIILSGSLYDGTAGLWAIKDQGGIAIVQDPKTAEFFDMPLNAINNVDVDYKLPVNEIAPLLIKLASQKSNGRRDDPSEREKIGIELDLIKNKIIDDEEINKIGDRSNFTCPECHGPLWKIEDGNIIRFRCRIGHAYSIESFLDEQNNLIEKSIWAALQAMEENLSFFEFMIKNAKEKGDKEKLNNFISMKNELKNKTEKFHEIINKKEI